MALQPKPNNLGHLKATMKRHMESLPIQLKPPVLDSWDIDSLRRKYSELLYDDVVGIDCETTGIELRHDSRVFMVCLAFKSSGKRIRFKWKVSPETRSVIYDPEDVAELKKILDGNYLFVFHNALFDVLALTTIAGLNVNPFRLLKQCRDSMLESHLVSSSQSHALKPLGQKWAMIDQHDQEKLREGVNKARDEATRINNYFDGINKPKPIMLANEHAFAYSTNAPKDGWWVMDMWLPAALEEWKAKWYLKNPDAFRKMGVMPGSLKNEIELVDEYCQLDVDRTICLDHIFYPHIQDNEHLMFHFHQQHRLLEAVYRTQMVGTSIHYYRASDLKAEFKSKVKHHFDICLSIVGNPNFNLNSDDQLRVLLYQQWAMNVRVYTDPSTRFPNGQPSTSIDALQQMIGDLPEGSPKLKFIESLIRGKKFSKNVEYLTKYVDCSVRYHIGANDKDIVRHRIHPSYNPTGTNTTRMSGSNPNPQNVGKGKLGFDSLKELFADTNLSLRRVFGPSAGREWWSADYVQLQLAIFAFVSGDREMIAAILAKRDFHDFMTRKIFNVPANQKPDDGQRRIGKNVDFGYIFGAGASKIDRTAKMPGLSDTLKEMFPAVTATISRLSDEARKTGKVSVGGYPLDVDPERLYSALNYVVQGYEGLIVKKAMIDCHDYLLHISTTDQELINKGGAFITLNVHDELVFDFPIGEGDKHVYELYKLMKGAGAFFGMVTEVDFKINEDNWAEGIEVDFEMPVLEAV